MSIFPKSAIKEDTMIGKVTDVKRERGNLRIKVQYLEADEQIGEDIFLIAENGIEQTVLEEYIQKGITRIREELPSVPKDTSAADASIQIGDFTTEV
jgi:hypothetical protein